MQISEAAAFLAPTWPVFPCGANKQPLTETGYKAAVSDPNEARALFQRPGAVMIGVPTGAVSGHIVVDIDTKDGRDGRPWLAENEHRIPRTRRHSTMSSGCHLLFQAPPGFRIRNSVSRIAPGVDVRGDGGYTIVPPSPGYAIIDDAMPAPIPAWLLDLLAPPAPAPRPVAQVRAASGDGSAYGMAALDAECTAIMAAPFGMQETTLNAACLKIGALVSGGELAGDFALSSLTSAALGMASQPGRERWDPAKVQAKVRASFADGQRQPRQAPALVRRVTEEYAPPPGWQEPPPYDEPPPHWQAEPDVMPDAQPTPEPGRLPLPIIRFADAAPKLDAADFVEGVLTAGAMSVVYGESNSGKTFFALDLALHVALGRMWRDREVDQGFVLYLALEGSHGILNRIAAFKEAYRLEGVEVPFAVIPVSLNLLDPNADASAVIDTCMAVAAQYGMAPALIVVDTLARAIAGGNENAPEDMGALIKSGDMLRQSTGAHVMWIHHSGKDTAKGARGHSSLRAATDTEIEVTTAGANRAASVTKQRDMECVGTFTYTLRVIDLGTNRRGKPVTSCVVDHDAQPVTAGAWRPRLSGQTKQAFDILTDLLASRGESGASNVPAGQVSTQARWWRQAFYDRAMPDAEQDTKKKAFNRVANFLTENRHVCVNADRVWIPQ